MSFVRGARGPDHRFAAKQASDLSKLPTTQILGTPVDLLSVNVEALQGWLSWRVEEVLGGVEDEILAGMIGNVLEEEKARLQKIKGPKKSGWSPKELQQTLGPFLGEATALSFMEELWILLLDAQSSPDGIPQAWGSEQREKFANISGKSSDLPVERKPIKLGAAAGGPSMRVRSPERVIGRLLEEAREETRVGRDRGRYFNRDRSRSRSRSRERQRGRSREREQLKGSRRKSPSRERDSSADTYSSSVSRSPIRHRSRSRPLSSRSPRRSPNVSRRRSPSRSPVRSPSPDRKRHRHHRKRHHRRSRSPLSPPKSPLSPLRSPEMVQRSRNRSRSRPIARSRSPRATSPSQVTELERMLRQKALESLGLDKR